MRIPQKQEALTRYNKLKSTLATAAQKPSNQASFKQEGDRVELTQNVRFELDGQQVIVKKGSAFDNDILTQDSISTVVKNGNSAQVDKFEHFSEKRGFWPFKRDQEMLTVQYGDQTPTSFGSNSLTFEV